MWLGIKFEAWGFIFGAVALVLAFPLSLLANLATPHIRNWWAERTTLSAEKRIAALKSELADIERDCELVDRSLLVIMRVQRTTLSLLGSCFCLICGGGVAAATWLEYDWTAPGHKLLARLLLAVLFFAVVLGSLSGFRVLERLQRYTRQHSASYRDYLKESIEKLESRLKR